MADLADMANALMEFDNLNALNRFKQKKFEDVCPALKRYCLECNDVLPEARKKLGFRLCYFCAQLMEKINSRSPSDL